MPQFESPLGNKKITVQPMKEVEIPDESGYDESEQSAPIGGGNFQPSVTHRHSVDEASIREFQARMQAKMNPESDLSQAEREIQQARHARRHGKERLNDGAKRRIEMLIGLTRGTHSVEIDGQNYSFHSLKGSEMREAYFATAEFDGTVQFSFELRRQLLARSLTEVVGVEIEQFVGSADLGAKLNLIDEMDDALLNRLYDEYLIMVKNTKEKYAVKTEAQVQEVVEDLKK